MSARDEVLARIRTALGPSPSPPPARVAVPRAYRRAGVVQLAPADLVDLLDERLVDYRAGVTRCADGAVGCAVAGILEAHGVRRLVVPDGVPDAWLTDAPDLERLPDDPPLSPEQLDAADGVLTGCAVAIAETGTIVLDAGPSQGRRALTLVPDLHVLVVRLDQIVAEVPDALARLEPTRPQTWISGPSATSDIELNRVEGVHGPRVLEVVLALPEPLPA